MLGKHGFLFCDVIWMKERIEVMMLFHREIWNGGSFMSNRKCCICLLYMLSIVRFRINGYLDNLC